MDNTDMKEAYEAKYGRSHPDWCWKHEAYDCNCPRKSDRTLLYPGEVITANGRVVVRD